LEETFDSKVGSSSYTPKIMEISLQSFSAKNIQPPQGLQLFLGSSYVAVSSEEIYIAGGYNPSTNEYMSTVYKYEPLTNTFKELPPLNHARAYHCSTFLNNKLYVFGGKVKPSKPKQGSRDIMTNSCEVYDVETQKWTALSPLKKARAFAYCCIFKGGIYVLGGLYQNEGKINRIRSIEIFSIGRKTWTFHTHKLPYGIVASSIIPNPHESSLIILGGSYEGKLHWNLEFDLENGYLMCKEPLRLARSNCIGGVFQDKIYVFGGDELNSVETFNTKEREWNVQVNKLGGHGQKDTDFKFIAADQPLAIHNANPSSLSKFKTEITDYSDVALVFGDSNNPFILEIDLKNEKIISRPIPAPLVLYNNQPGVRIKGTNPPQYFLVGGIQNSNEPVKRVFIYDPFANKAKRVANMNIKRELCTVIQKGDMIYAIGGKNYLEGEDNILSSVERTNISGAKWSLIANLNIERCDAISFLVNDSIYVAGGSAGAPYTYEGQTSKNHIVNLIERYNEVQNVWEVLNFKVEISLEGALALQTNTNEIVVFGGVKPNEKGEGAIGSNEIKKYTFGNNDDLVETSLGKMSQPRMNVMGLEFSKGFFLLAGGDDCYCEIFDKNWKLTSQEFSQRVYDETEILNKGNENYYQLVL